MKAKAKPTTPAQRRKIYDTWVQMNYPSNREVAEAMGLKTSQVDYAIDVETKARKKA